MDNSQEQLPAWNENQNAHECSRQEGKIEEAFLIWVTQILTGEGVVHDANLFGNVFNKRVVANRAIHFGSSLFLSVLLPMVMAGRAR